MVWHTRRGGGKTTGHSRDRRPAAEGRQGRLKIRGGLRLDFVRPPRCGVDESEAAGVERLPRDEPAGCSSVFPAPPALPGRGARP